MPYAYSSPTKPSGIVQVVGLIAKESVNAVGVSATIICEDAQGLKWEYGAPCNNVDLQPYCDSQESCYSSWFSTLKQSLHVTLNFEEISLPWLEQQYRLGSSIEEVGGLITAYREARSGELLRSLQEAQAALALDHHKAFA